MASRFWVGGTGNWDASTTTNWAATSGGVGGQSVPTSSDTVTFDTLSNATGYTVTVSATANCSDLVIGAPLTGALTFAGSSALNIFGNFSIAGTNVTRTYSIAPTFAATTTGKTITMNGITWAGLTFNGVGGGWTFQDAVDIGTGTLTLTNGTLNTGNQTVALGTLSSSNTNTRVLTLGSSVFTFSTNGGITFTDPTGMTLTANTSTMNLLSDNFGITQQLGGFTTWNILSFTCIGGVTSTLASSFTCATLTLTGDDSKTSVFSFTGNPTVTGVLTITGNSDINRAFVRSSVVGTPRTITAGTVTVTKTDFQDITGAGAGSWNLASVSGGSGDCGGNSGITFTSSATQYYQTAVTSSWSDSTKWFLATNGGGGAGRVPLPQDDAVFDANSVATTGKTISTDMPRLGRNITFANVANTPTISFSNTLSIFGSLTMGTVTISGTSFTTTFAGRSIYSITSNTLTFSSTFIVDAPGGTYNLGDDFATGATRSFTLTSGTFDASGFNFTTGSFSSSNSNTRTLNMGSGTWTLAGTSAIWTTTTQTGLTFNKGASTIKVTDASATTKAFNFGGLAVNNLWLTGTGSGKYQFNNDGNFNEFKDDNSVAHTIQFLQGSTITVSSWNVIGHSGAAISIISSSTNNFTITKSSGVVISDYLIISDSTATGGAVWYAGTSSTDNGGGNSGWIFNTGAVNVSESVSVTEAISATSPLSVFELVTLTESTTILIPVLFPFVFNTATVTESISMVMIDSVKLIATDLNKQGLKIIG